MFKAIKQELAELKSGFSRRRELRKVKRNRKLRARLQAVANEAYRLGVQKGYNIGYTNGLADGEYKTKQQLINLSRERLG